MYYHIILFSFAFSINPSLLCSLIWNILLFKSSVVQEEIPVQVPLIDVFKYCPSDAWSIASTALTAEKGKKHHEAEQW